MFKKVFFIVGILVLFCANVVFAEETHFLRKSWYNEASAYLPKEKVTGISLICDEAEPKNYDFTWNIDNFGLKGFIVDDTEVIIHFPDGDKLKTDAFADGLFSFCTFIKNTDYETGDDGVLIRGVRSEDHMYDDDYYAEYKTSLLYIENLGLLDTSSATNMEKMFYGDRKLTNLDVSYFNTRLATNMKQMFFKCENLTTLDLSVFDTSSVTDMSSMFADCTKLKHIDMSYFNTSNVTNMWRMFYKCESLITVNVSNFDTSNVEEMGNMFARCTNLQALDLSNFKVEHLKSIHGMFDSCENLTVVNLNTFNSKVLGDASFMFRKCKNLVALDLNAIDMTYADIAYIFVLADRLRYISINDSFAKKLPSSKLEGVWRNITTGQVYNGSDTNMENIVLTAGVYEKIGN